MTFALTADLSAANALIRTTGQVRARLTTAANEAVTGQRDARLSSLGARSGEMSVVEKALGDLDAGAGRLSLASSRLGQTAAALTAMRGMIGGLGERALTDVVLGGGVGAVETADTATAALSQVLSTLNAQHAGRHLFAGDAVSGPAVATPDAVLSAVRAELTGAADAADADARLDAFFAAGGGYDTLVYLGGDGEAASAALGDGSVVRFEAKADGAPIRDAVEGLVRLVVLPNVAGDRTAWTERAAGRLDRAEEAMVVLEARGGLAAERVEGAMAAGRAERLVLTEAREALVGRDPYEAASEVQRLEAQLEAAYAMTARIGRMRFSDYMR